MEGLTLPQQINYDMGSEKENKQLSSLTNGSSNYYRPLTVLSSQSSPLQPTQTKPVQSTFTYQQIINKSHEDTSPESSEENCNSDITQASIPPKINKQQQELHRVKEDNYERNRINLHGWMHRECAKCHLQYETFANAIALMDEYYKYNPFIKERFLQYALCIMVISSKALEEKVLFTTSVANANKFDQQQTIKTEIEILTFFEFKVASYNFARVVAEFMQRWDEAVREEKYHFFKEGALNYQLYLEVLTLCQYHLRFKGSLLQPAIKRIFLFILEKFCNDINVANILNYVFSAPCIEASGEMLFAFQIKEETEEMALKSLEKWHEQFKANLSDIRKRYTAYEMEKSKYKCYGEFLSLLPPQLKTP